MQQQTLSIAPIKSYRTQQNYKDHEQVHRALILLRTSHTTVSHTASYLVHVFPFEHTLHRTKDLLLSNLSIVILDFKDCRLKVEAFVPNTLASTQQLAAAFLALQT